MIVLDVETSGTEPTIHGLLSIGAVDFESSGRQFYEECRLRDGAHILEEALVINGYTREDCINPDKKSESEILQKFITWIEESSDHTIAGQNPLFDMGFLRAVADRNHISLSLAHRTIDLHSVTYFHMIRRGITPPLRNKRTDLNSDKIMEYVGIPAEPKPHIALNGAKWEAEAFSRLFHEKALFEEFVSYPIPWRRSEDVTRHGRLGVSRHLWTE